MRLILTLVVWACVTALFPEWMVAQQENKALAIVKQPDDAKQEVGKTAVFSVTVEAPDAPGFQWFKNGAAVQGASLSTYTTPPVKLSDNGAKFKVIITSGTNRVESREAVLTVVPATREVVRGFLKADVFTEIPGNSLELDLRSHPKYLANRPDRSEFITIFEYPSGSSNEPPPADSMDNYGVRISGFIVPQQSGRYVFSLASDGPGELYLSHNEDPASQVLIASEPFSNPARSFATIEGRPGCPDACENVSAPVPLEAGKRYSIRAEMKESTGGDNLAVTWATDAQPPPPNGAIPILSSFLAAETNPNLAPDIQITQQPQNVTGSEGSRASLSVAATSTMAIAFQWQKAAVGSTNFTDVPGANAASFTTPPLLIGDSGTRYRAVLSVPGRSVFSGEAVVIVQRDPNAVTIDSIKLQGSNITITWTGGGVLQSASDLSGPWTDVAGAVSPYTASVAGTRKFFRVKR